MGAGGGHPKPKNPKPPPPPPPPPGGGGELISLNAMPDLQNVASCYSLRTTDFYANKACTSLLLSYKYIRCKPSLRTTDGEFRRELVAHNTPNGSAMVRGQSWCVCKLYNSARRQRKDTIRDVIWLESD